MEKTHQLSGTSENKESLEHRQMRPLGLFLSTLIARFLTLGQRVYPWRRAPWLRISSALILLSGPLSVFCSLNCFQRPAISTKP
jgi:hypothetical protein